MELNQAFTLRYYYTINKATMIRAFLVIAATISVVYLLIVISLNNNLPLGQLLVKSILTVLLCCIFAALSTFGMLFMAYRRAKKIITLYNNTTEEDRQKFELELLVISENTKKIQMKEYLICGCSGEFIMQYMRLESEFPRVIAYKKVDTYNHYLIMQKLVHKKYKSQHIKLTPFGLSKTKLKMNKNMSSNFIAELVAQLDEVANYMYNNL